MTRVIRYPQIVLVILLVCFASSLSLSATKKSQLKSKLGKVQVQIRDVRRKIHVTEVKKKDVTGQLTSTQQKLEVTQSRLSRNKLRLMDVQADLRATTLRLARTKRQLARRQHLMSRRIVDVYEGEDISYANVVLGSTDMWTFLSRAYYLKQIINFDSNLIEEIGKDKIQIENDQKRQTKRVVQVRGLQSQLESQRNEVADLAENQRQQLAQIESNKDLYEKVLDELEAMSNEIESRIRAFQSSPTGRVRLAKVFRGGLSMPCSGSVGSRFGYRVHPITHVYKLHTGVDIRARSGAPIHAAADGVVVICGWMGAYGNAVVIDHGGGVSTLYGHCSRLMTRYGAKVSRGQLIGLVGSTGYSTGPHCHFEKRINGTPVNPL